LEILYRKKLLEKPRLRWEDNIKTDFKERAYMEEMRNAHNILIEKPERKKPLGKLSMCRGIILKCIKQFCVRILIRFIWFRIWYGSGLF
jgi:hypothetical protein